jgi:hypothetical protein
MSNVSKRTIGQLGAEGRAAIWRAQYWAAQTKWWGVVFAMALVSVGVLVVGIRKHLSGITQNMSMGGATADSAMKGIVGLFCVFVIWWSAWELAKVIRAQGLVKPEKAALEVEIAQLRGEALARRESEFLQAEIEAQADARCADAKPRDRRTPKRI